jgi:hypothetical protein
MLLCSINGGLLIVVSDRPKAEEEFPEMRARKPTLPMPTGPVGRALGITIRRIMAMVVHPAIKPGCPKRIMIMIN